MAKQVAKQHCRKINADKVPWTLVVTQAIYQILNWKGVRKDRKEAIFATWYYENEHRQGWRYTPCNM